MKKKSFLSIFLIIFPLLIAIGFSTWIIMYEIIITPSRVQTSPISDYFGISQEATYNSEEQAPIQQSGETIDTSLISYQYKLASDTNENNYVDGKPINAGIYDVKVIVENLGECKVLFTIHPKKIRLASSTFEINYDEKYISWAQMQFDINSMISFVDESNVAASELVTGDYKINGMHNGLYYYGTLKDTTGLTDATKVSTTSHIIGSTYTAQIELHEDLVNNYEFLKTPICIIKYKTAIVNGTYYTIEDAFNQNGMISFIGDATNTSSHIITSFSQLKANEGNPYSTNTYILSNRTLIVPYNNSNDSHNIDTSRKANGNVYSALIIPENITINLVNNSALTAAAFIGFSQPKITISCDRGVIMNYGTINVESGCTINSYGYIKGTGTINLSSGSSAIDCMTTYDWPGGTAGSKMYTDVMPTNAWSLHNISCTTIINAGATYSGYIHVILSASILGDKALDSTTVIVGNSSSSNCIFKLKSGYVKKTTANAKSWSESSTNYKNLFEITGSNQIAGQRDVIELNGISEDGVLNVSMTFLLTVKMQSSTSIPAPIGFMDIIINENSELTLTKSDYMFLPGSSLYVRSGAIVNVGANVDISFTTWNQFSSYTKSISFASKCVDKVDSYVEINGTLNINGSIGGKIYTTQSGAILNFSNANTTSTFISMYDTNEPYYFTENCTANGNINGNDNSNFSTNSYVSVGNGSSYYWTEATNVTTFRLDFYDSDKSTLLQSKNIQVVNANFYTITGNEYNPDKVHYDFIKWVLDDNSDASGLLLTDSNIVTNIYAIWTPHIYSFSYTAGYGTASNGNINYITDNVIFQNKLENFTIEDFSSGKLNISTLATYNEKNFNGWYIGIDSSTGIKFSEITISQLEMFVEEFGDTIPIPLYCYFSDEIEYTIQFVDNNDQNSDPQSTTIIGGNSITLPSFDRDFNTDDQFNKYFVGWYATSNYDKNSLFDASTLVDGTYANANNVITLYAKWDNKYSLNVHTSNTSTYYYMPNTSVNLNIFDTSKVGYTFNSWYDNASYSGNALTESITITKDMDVHAKYSVNSYKVSISGSGNQTVTIKDENGRTINNGDLIEYGTVLTISIPNYYSVWGSGTPTSCTITFNGNAKVIQNTGSSNPIESRRGTTTDTYNMPAGEISIVIS